MRSESAQVPAPGRSVYSATKAGLIGMTKASSLDVGPFGITVNCIALGPFLTDLPRKVFTQEMIDAVSQRTAVGRADGADGPRAPARERRRQLHHGFDARR